MKKSIKLGLVASALMAITGTVSAQMKDITVVDTKESPYVIDARGVIVRDPFGLCWRTGSWSAERAAKTVIKEAKYPNWTAICECEVESLWKTQKPACEPPPPKLAGVSLEVIIAVGFTDRLGPLAHNQKLSVARAQAVKDYLVSKGIEPNRIYTEGKGPANPVKQCPDPSPKGEVRNFKQLVECLQPNRRVEVEVVGTRPVRR